jgi:enterochelin esterase-like enzyme/outer membrane protein assembly factor BamB
MFRDLIWLVTLVLVLSILPAAATADDDWPTFRGISMDGIYTGDVFADDIGLEVAWKRPVGSAYSSISLVDGRGVTFTTDGETDFLTAFDAATGETIWSTAISEMYAGHSGSDDGGIGTPAIHDGFVYAVGPRGDIVALRLKDGGEVWRHRLSEADSRAPHYGYSTSPLVAGDAVIVETGGDAGHGITAFDRRSGDKLWSRGNDMINHQSPVLATISGREQVIAPTDSHLRGLDPATGDELWSHPHEVSARFQGQQPIDLGDGRFLLTFNSESVAIEVQAQDGTFSAADVWRRNAFRGNYALPVLHEGYLYGFAGNYLSCVNPVDGEVMWRSRPPGGHGLILVDGHLVILNKSGELVIVRASPDGYDERARRKVLENGYFTPPSYAGGHVYARNLSEMVSVRISTEALAEAAPAKPEVVTPQGVLGELASEVAAATSDDAKKKVVDAFLASQKSFPIYEAGSTADLSLVHLLYRGDAEELVVLGNLEPNNEQLPLYRLPGTDLFWRSLEFHPAAHFQYAFLLNYGDEWVLDTLNPHSLDNGRREYSELRMPEWRVPTHLVEPEEPRGAIDTFQFKSNILDNIREIKVYMPPSYADDEIHYPVLFVHSGDTALHSMKMANTLDNLIQQERMQPLIAVFVPRNNGSEYGGPNSDAYVRLLHEELLPHLSRHYRTLDDPATRGAMGVGSGAMMSFYSAFKTPQTFGRVASQSFYIRGETAQQILPWIAEAEPSGQRFYVEWSHNDYVGAEIDAAADSQKLIAALRAKGHTVNEATVHGAAGLGSWRGQTDLILEYLYPPIVD